MKVSKSQLARYNAAIDTIEQSIVEEKASRRMQLWRKALIQATTCWKKSPIDDDVTFLVAYVYCSCPKKNPEIWRRAKHFLRSALRQNPKHELARYHLACAYFDCKQYAEALKELKQLPRDAFQKLGQPWRTLKMAELRLCCELYLNPNFMPRLSLARFKKLYSSFEEPILAPTPREFADCLRYLLSKKLSNRRALVRFCRIARVLFNRLDLDEHFKQYWPDVQATV